MPCSLGDEAAIAVSSTSQSSEPLALVVVCAWCGRPMGRGTASSHRIVSHGICRPCSVDVLFFSESEDLLLRR